MKTGFRGTFVISWTQTEIDGHRSAPLRDLRVGATWGWRGDTMRVDGPKGILPLGDAAGEADLRKRAACSVRKLYKAADLDPVALPVGDADDPLFDKGFVVTDGRDTWTITLADNSDGQPPLCVFNGEIPPRGTDMWIVSHNIDLHVRDQAADPAGGVICFTPDTMILTEHGPMPVQEITPDIKLQTKDNGCQEVLWKGQRRVTGARLYAMPQLAPIRLSQSALDVDIPDQSLLVSPDHRVMVRGPRARMLFNTEEVLVAAKDLVNDAEIYVDRAMREVSYIHLLLPQHEIVFANGVETESFHPASAALATMGEADQSRLFACMPEIEGDVRSYGGYARRMLAHSEAAILRYDAA